ncbi:dGTP triphosphohydrolase [Pseudoalteromonas shioyasakiensis]|uniref:dGTP triphosphohydrolase n=1 Tax=Pseudoalteromonas shioyasakiensis TaxID=1190813 RepID=UPI001C3E7111|nr:dNTP triphosphohydrolase [Pseudoalteromonas shioyasakiensis]
MVWEKQLRLRIQYLRNQGFKTLEEIVPYCEGASPSDVEMQMKEMGDNGKSENIASLDYRNKFFFNLPAPNPLYYQWWYTLGSQEEFVGKVLSSHDNAKVLCIGTPTIASALNSYGVDATLLDIDLDIIKLFKKTYGDKNESQHYDIFDELPQELHNKFDLTIIDPPWYKEYFEAFLSRSIKATKDGGLIYCSIPQVLTRASISDERKELIEWLKGSGHEVLCIEKSSFKYIVPEFEGISFKEKKLDMSSQPWRASDLLVIQVKGNKELAFSGGRNNLIRSFSREGSQSIFRVFLEEKNIVTGVGPRRSEGFKESISRREHKEEVNVWTSKKDGFQFEDLNVVENVLSCWSDGKSKAETIEALQPEYQEIKNIVEKHDELLELWSRHADGDVRRTARKIKEINDSSHSQWASQPSAREYGSKTDGFRIEFQRDRDRVIWSSGFRKLADKTQLFPLDQDENLRQRLAHSIEVMQLATTISNSFGLNNDLVEAGALAHDVGHTPFGHAGENAIDRLFVALGVACGFNHYEHGVDVVRYLEGSYQNSAFEIHNGLNLTPEVCDCILKHTYCHSGGVGSHKDVWDKSKHKEYLKCSGFSHLEGQAVRAADKISYLLSDIEDGIRLGAISHQDLMYCRLFHRSPIDFRMKSDDILYLKFIEQRGAIIKLLMEDIILESSKRISSLTSINEVRNADDYCIYHSREIMADMSEIWEKIQVRRLHRDPRVITANLKASKVVTELVILFTLFPEYIDERFRKEHERLRTSGYMKHYESDCPKVNIPENFTSFLPLNFMIDFSTAKLNGIPIYDLVIAKDYVASFSDNKCNQLHRELLTSKF